MADVKDIDICCVECGCEYMLPMMKLTYIKSFAGNRLQNVWPVRTQKGDTALITCPACGLCMRIKEDGEVDKLETRWWAKRKAKKVKKA